MNWDVIIPFLRPIEPFLLDPDISDILVNGAEHVFVERRGRLEAVPALGLTEKSLLVAVRNIARALGDDVGPESPLLDARLPDGSRVAAVLPPCSVAGTILAIRKFHGQRLAAEELVRAGSLTPELLTLLRTAVEQHRNILIAGGSGAGKTTLLNALASYVDPDERVVVIEDTAEIQLNLPHLVRLETRRGRPPVDAVTMRDLLKVTLRLRPDRILVGEVRGGEAFDLLQALNTGHAGMLSTLHANSAGQAIARFTTCVLLSGVELPYKAVRSNIGEALDLLVHVARLREQRQVTEVFALKSYDPALDRYDLECLYGRG